MTQRCESCGRLGVMHFVRLDDNESPYRGKYASRFLVCDNCDLTNLTNTQESHG